MIETIFRGKQIFFLIGYETYLPSTGKNSCCYYKHGQKNMTDKVIGLIGELVGVVYSIIVWPNSLPDIYVFICRCVILSTFVREALFLQWVRAIAEVHNSSKS